ncbi:uncharacterized protein VNE69_06117 [Vairimorpha necatrix]|uniref:Uncharacterized protein n=1 Tax=Vairimorpha necatrix TaxID=6039 RepID=A0AAX4JD17_9MICR
MEDSSKLEKTVKLSNFNEYTNKITVFLQSYNIVLDVKILLSSINTSNRSFKDVLDTFLLKYSEKYKILNSLYNKEYPYDLEINKKLNLQNIKYDVKNENFYGVKFNNFDIKNILEICTTNNVLVKGLLVDRKYNIEYLVNYISKMKIDIEIKILIDNIYNIFVVVKDQNSPLINKIVLYEIFKKLKGTKEMTHSGIYTRDVKISVINNKFLERFYSDNSVYFSNKSDNNKDASSNDIVDISYCIREYLDRNGFLIHFSTLCIDSISIILNIKNKNSTDYLRDFLRFKFTGYKLINNSISNTSDNNILISIYNFKYTVTYPPLDILNRLKYLNKQVYTQYYTKIMSSYYKCRDINSKLNFINYNDYDLVLSKINIKGSLPIKYKEDVNEIFEYRDSRVYMFYSRSSHTLMVKYKEEIDREMFLMYLISSCKFDYVLKNY